MPGRRAVAALAAFSALSAVGGGIQLAAFPETEGGPPLWLLAHTPFRSFLVPGLVLAVAIGGTSLASALLVWRRSRAAVDATLLAGGALSVWIVAQVAMLRSFHWLHGIYLALGAALLALGVRAAWRTGSPRHRWVFAVTAAETLGFLVPGAAGILSYRAGTGPLAQTALLVAAGAVEGLALGAGQAWAMPLPVRRARYALLTAAAAGWMWAAIMVAMRLAPALPAWAAAVAGVSAGATGLAAMGALQWLELRHHGGRASVWIPWTALAWVLALPLSFAPGPFLDESTPPGPHLALWGCGGLLMAYVMALVTWQGVRRLPRAAPTPAPPRRPP